MYKCIFLLLAKYPGTPWVKGNERSSGFIQAVTLVAAHQMVCIFAVFFTIEAIIFGEIKNFPIGKYPTVITLFAINVFIFKDTRKISMQNISTDLKNKQTNIVLFFTTSIIIAIYAYQIRSHYGIAPLQ